MDSNQQCSSSVIRMLVLDHDEDQEEQHGANAMVLNSEKERDKKEVVECKPPQGEFDQHKSALVHPVQDKPVQEELAQVSVSEEAAKTIEKGENKTEEIGGQEAGEGSSGPLYNQRPVVDSNSNSAQRQPQEEAEMPEGTRSVNAGAMLIVRHNRRFTTSQLHNLKNLFQDISYASLCEWNKSAERLSVLQAKGRNWFRIRREIIRRSSRILNYIGPRAAKKKDL